MYLNATDITANTGHLIPFAKADAPFACRHSTTLRFEADQMTSHKTYNEPGPRPIGLFYSARLLSRVLSPFLRILSHVFVLVPSSPLSLLLGSSSFLHPPLPLQSSFLVLRSIHCTATVLVSWFDSVDGNPSNSLDRGLFRYKPYQGTVEIMKRRSPRIRRNSWNPC